jgi:hypothetical protein
MAKTTSKQNGPRVPILDEKMKTMKFSKDIIITSKLRDRQQTTCGGRNTKNITKMQIARIMCKEGSLTNM